MKEQTLSIFQNYIIITWRERKREIFKRICALFLTVTLLFNTVPQQVSAAYKSDATYLSLFYSQATIAEGIASGRAEQFFGYIAGIAMTDVEVMDFYEQMADAVDAGYRDVRIFVVHEKGMPDTDLALIYCFKNSTWVLKDTTRVRDSIYVDATLAPLEIIQGLDLNLDQQDLIDLVVPDNDSSYECNPELVWNIFMYFNLYVNERNRMIDIFKKGTSDQVQPLPEIIDEWPLSITVSVTVPAELQILEAFFIVDATGNAEAVQYEYVQDIPDSKRFAGTVDENNLVTATVLVWEPGPHLVRAFISVAVKDFSESMTYPIHIDTSNVALSGDSGNSIVVTEEQLEKECLHESTYLSEIEGTRIFAVMPGNDMRHYVTSSAYLRKCRKCNAVISSENLSMTYTVETTPNTDIHTPGADGKCIFCGFKMNDEALYLSYLKEAKRNGINPMADSRVTDLMWERFHKAGFTDRQWKEISNVLEKLRRNIGISICLGFTNMK